MSAIKPKSHARPSPAARPAEPPRAEAAFALLGPEMAALRPEALARINLDIARAVSLTLGVLPGLAALRSEIATLPDFDMRHFDRLETYALGAWYAYLLALPPASPGNPVQLLLEEASALRGRLLGDAVALAARGHLDLESVQAIRAGKGSLDTANDLVALSALMSASWPDIENKTAATAEEVHHAGDLGPQLIAALGLREHGAATPADASEAADRKVRAFTLFTAAYDQVRRAVIYLRWSEGDADSLAPSLYRGRGGSRSPGAAGAEPGGEGAPADAKGGDKKSGP
jgi:hypothetical protein